MKKILIYIIKFYKKFISPALVPVFGNACRFTPTCSEYTIQSIQKFGALKGSYLGIIRILKCNPYSTSY